MDGIVLDEIVVTDRFDPRVEQAASRFITQGYTLFDDNSRSLAPTQCLEYVLRDNQSIFVALANQFQRGIKRGANKQGGNPRKWWRIAP